MTRQGAAQIQAPTSTFVRDYSPSGPRLGLIVLSAPVSSTATMPHLGIPVAPVTSIASPSVIKHVSSGIPCSTARTNTTIRGYK